MRRRIVFCVALLAFGCGAAFSQNVEFSGEVGTLWGVALPWSGKAGDLTMGSVWFNGSVDAWNNESSAFVDATAGYDCTSRELYFSLDEAWADYSTSYWGIRIGRQKASWGKADGVAITNVICPEDLTSVFSDDSSLGVDALRLSVTGSSFAVDAWWIPFFRGSVLPLDESNPLREYVVPTTADLSALSPGLVVPVEVGDITQPGLSIQNGEYALKASGYFTLLDASLYAFYGWDDVPLLSYALDAMPPSKITVSGEYKRMLMFGADAAVPIGPTVLRLEAAFFPMRQMQKSVKSVLSDSTAGEAHNQLEALLGIDWMPDGWTLTAQYFCDYVFDLGEKLQREDAYTHGATVSVSKSVLNDTLSLSASALVGFNAWDSLVSVSADYSLTDALTVSGGVTLFNEGPEKKGTYGAYKDLSSAYVSASFSF